MLLIPLSTGSYKKTCIIGVSYNNIFVTKHYNNILATQVQYVVIIMLTIKVPQTFT